MLVPAQERGWGRASELAQQHGISRTLLYDWRDKALNVGTMPVNKLMVANAT